MTASHSATLAGDPAAIFDAITDIAGLPSWNTIMRRVVDKPVDLAPGAEWVVEFRAMGSTWRSRSTCEELDRAARRFRYESRTDDGNPSRAVWTWHVAADPAGARVTVEWNLLPATFWRRVLLAKIRERQLRSEIPASLAALEQHVAASSLQ